MLKWNIKASDKFEAGWSKVNLLSDKKIHKIVFVYFLATLLYYLINIFNYQPYTAEGRIINVSLIYFLLLFVGSLWINQVINNKHYKFILFFLLINSLFFYLVSVNYYFSLGYILNFYFINKLISEKENKMNDLGLSFKDLKKNILMGIVTGILSAAYFYFIISLAQGYKFKILNFNRYLEYFLGNLILGIFILTFFIGVTFNHLLKKGTNFYSSILVVAISYTIFNLGYVEIFKDMQAVSGYVFITIINTFFYCGIFLLYRNILPIALLYTIPSIIAYSFGVAK